MKSSGWVVGEKFFHNKWKAIEYATKHPEFSYGAYCNDYTWDKADWTTEPKEDIRDLEIQHCEYLRKKYKTLVLYYSGGVDSTTVLQRFVENKIPIDYICVCYTKEPNAKFNRDTQLAKQYLDSIKSKLMNAEILYTSKLDHHEGNSIYNYTGNIFETNWQLRFHHNGFQEHLRIRYPDIFSKVKQNGCIVTGSDKPFVYRDANGKYYAQYIDQHDENWGQSLLEMFWKGADPRLQIKQCHLAKNWLVENDYSDTNFFYEGKDTEKFWHLNQTFGRTSIDPFFYKKHCFGETLEDRYFSQHYNSTWGNSYFAEQFKFFKNTKKYNELAEVVEQLQKKDSRFFSNYKVMGWLSTRRYLD